MWIPFDVGHLVVTALSLRDFQLQCVCVDGTWWDLTVIALLKMWIHADYHEWTHSQVVNSIWFFCDALLNFSDSWQKNSTEELLFDSLFFG